MKPYAIEAGFDNGDGTYSIQIRKLPLDTETHKDYRAHEKLLYTHPAKTLTKDKLKIMWQAAISKAYKEDEGEAYEFFAEALLRKAQDERK